MHNIVYVSTKQSNCPFEIFIAIDLETHTQSCSHWLSLNMTNMRLGWRADGERSLLLSFSYYFVMWFDLLLDSK